MVIFHSYVSLPKLKGFNVGGSVPGTRRGRSFENRQWLFGKRQAALGIFGELEKNEMKLETKERCNE